MITFLVCKILSLPCAVHPVWTLFRALLGSCCLVILDLTNVYLMGTTET